MTDRHPQKPTPLLVVVTGPPAAGKTALARPIADRLGLPLIEKDALKEALHDGGVPAATRAESQRLGVATFAALFRVLDELLRAGCSVVAEGNFRRADPFVRLPPARVVQVHVTASAAALRTRFLERTSRHAVHYDAEVVDEIPAAVAAGEWRPLQLGGELVEVDTTEFPDPAAVADQVVRAATRSRA